jgi:hypothetical protein
MKHVRKTVLPENFNVDYSALFYPAAQHGMEIIRLPEMHDSFGDKIDNFERAKDTYDESHP